MNNPNGANGTTSDPREQLCWDNYVARGLENAFQSALEAGYEESTAKNVTMRGWFKERLDRLRRKDMLSKAEKVLDKTLSYSTEDEEGKVRVDLLRVQTDVAKTVVTTLGKSDYSTKGEDAAGNLADNIKTLIINKQYGNDNKPV